MQISTEAQRAAIKTATRAAVARAGGLEAASTITRLAKSQLARVGDRNAEETFAPADVVLDLDLCAGEPVVTQALAAAQGYLLLPVDLGAGDIAQSFQDIAERAGRTMADALVALAAADLTDERRAVLVADLGRLSLAVQHALRCVVPPRGPGAVTDLDVRHSAA